MIHNEAAKVDSKKPEYLRDPVMYELEEQCRPDMVMLHAAASSVIGALLPSYPNARVLDVGCGTGLSMQRLVHTPGISTLQGIDMTPEFLHYAQARFAAHSHVSVQYGDIFNSPKLSEAPWDIIVTASTYHHIEDNQKIDFLKVLKTLLKPGGVLVLVDSMLPEYASGNPDAYSNAVTAFYRAVRASMKAHGVCAPKAVSQVIDTILSLGQEGEEEFKVSLRQARHDWSAAGLNETACIKAWPHRGPLANVDGGNYVIIAQPV